MQKGTCVGNFEGAGGGIKSPEFEHKFTHMLDTAGDWKNKSNMLVDELRRAGDGWHSVGRVNKAYVNIKKRPTAIRNEKFGSGGEPGVNSHTSTPAQTKVY